jgi:hypothetical protein
VVRLEPLHRALEDPNELPVRAAELPAEGPERGRRIVAKAAVVEHLAADRILRSRRDEQSLDQWAKHRRYDRRPTGVTECVAATPRRFEQQRCPQQLRGLEDRPLDPKLCERSPQVGHRLRLPRLVPFEAGTNGRDTRVLALEGRAVSRR